LRGIIFTSNQQEESHKSNQYKIGIIKIKLNDNKIETIQIFNDTDSEKSASEFCRQYSISLKSSFYFKLVYEIMQKIEIWKKNPNISIQNEINYFDSQKNTSSLYQNIEMKKSYKDSAFNNIKTPNSFQNLEIELSNFDLNSILSDERTNNERKIQISQKLNSTISKSNVNGQLSEELKKNISKESENKNKILYSPNLKSSKENFENKSNKLLKYYESQLKTIESKAKKSDKLKVHLREKELMNLTFTPQLSKNPKKSYEKKLKLTPLNLNGLIIHNLKTPNSCLEKSKFKRINNANFNLSNEKRTVTNNFKKFKGNDINKSPVIYHATNICLDENNNIQNEFGISEFDFSFNKKNLNSLNLTKSTFQYLSSSNNSNFVKANGLSEFEIIDQIK